MWHAVKNVGSLLLYLSLRLYSGHSQRNPPNRTGKNADPSAAGERGRSRSPPRTGPFPTTTAFASLLFLGLDLLLGHRFEHDGRPEGSVVALHALKATRWARYDAAEVV